VAESDGLEKGLRSSDQVAAPALNRSFLKGTGRLKARLGDCWRQLLPKKLPKSA
jgi:hypothetical protein